MKYALLIYPGAPGEEYWRNLTDEQQKAMGADYRALGQEPGVFGSAQLQSGDTATTIRTEHGQTVTADGPGADNAVAGIYFLEADDLDAALEVAARVPAARLGGAVEVRPMVER